MVGEKVIILNMGERVADLSTRGLHDLFTRLRKVSLWH